MDALNEFFLTKLEWTWHIEYASLILIVAAALALILLITLIVVAVRHGKNKRKIADLQNQVNSLSSRQAYEQTTQDIDIESVRTELRKELEADIRAEVEPELRAKIENEYVTILAAQSDESDENAAAAAQEIARLNDTVSAQEKQISDLNNALMQSSSAYAGDSEDLFKTINELTDKNKQLQNDVNILRAENSQLRTQAKKESVLLQARQKPAPAVKQKEEVRIVAKKPVTKTPEPVIDDDDEDEYDNEFGDENSLVKVTLKYDRVKQNWVIYRSDTDRAYRRLGTKQDALPVAKDLARRLHAQLVVHKKDGKFQRV